MQARQRQALRSFRRVREFLGANVPAGAPASLGRQLAELDDVLVKFARMGQEQDAAIRLTQSETRRQRALRETLWYKQMQPISRVAREVFGTSPGAEAALRMPKKLADGVAMVAAAGAMAEAAEKHRQAFVEHGLPTEFVQQLRDAAAAVQNALSARETTVRRKVTATAAVTQQLKRGKRAVRLLNAIMAPRLASDPDLLAAWTSARKVSATPGGSSVAVEEESQPPVVKVA